MSILVEDIFSKLTKNFLRREEKSKWRLTEAGKVMDSFTFSMTTGGNDDEDEPPPPPPPPPQQKKKRKVKKFISPGIVQFKFPDEVLIDLLFFLPFNDIFSVMLTHKAVFLLVASNEYFWNRKFEMEFGFPYPKYMAEKNKHKNPWKRMQLFFERIKNKKTIFREECLKGNEIILLKIITYGTIKKFLTCYFESNKELNTKFLVKLINRTYFGVVDIMEVILNERYNDKKYDRKKVLLTFFNDSNHVSIYIILSIINKHSPNNTKYRKLLKDKEILINVIRSIRRANQSTNIVTSYEDFTSILDFFKVEFDKDVVMEIIIVYNKMILQFPKFVYEKDIFSILYSNEYGRREILYIDGLLLRKFEDRFKSKNNVILSVNQNGLALQYAPNFKDNSYVVGFAIRQTPNAIQYASERLKNIYDIEGIDSREFSLFDYF